jgi:hypothetical protein
MLNNLKPSVEELMKIDETIAEMNRHPIDYSDIPRRKPGAKVRWGNEAWLNSLPREVLQEMARKQLLRMKAGGYNLPEDIEELLRPTIQTVRMKADGDKVPEDIEELLQPTVQMA